MDLLSLAHEVSTVDYLHDKARFPVSVVVATTGTGFWNATTFSLIEIYQTFGETYCFILHGEEISSPLSLD